MTVAENFTSYKRIWNCFSYKNAYKCCTEQVKSFVKVRDNLSSILLIEGEKGVKLDMPDFLLYSVLHNLFQPLLGIEKFESMYNL